MEKLSNSNQEEESKNSQIEMELDDFRSNKGWDENNLDYYEPEKKEKNN